MPPESVLAYVRLGTNLASQNLMHSMSIHVNAQIVFSDESLSVMIADENFGLVRMPCCQVTFVISFRLQLGRANFANHNIQRLPAVTNFFVSLELLLSCEQLHFATLEAAEAFGFPLESSLVDMIFCDL